MGCWNGVRGQQRDLGVGGPGVCALKKMSFDPGECHGESWECEPRSMVGERMSRKAGGRKYEQV